jgi:dsDNA-binding SOS-regulon protein
MALHDCDQDADCADAGSAADGVREGLVEMAHALEECLEQVTLAEHEDVVEALAALVAAQPRSTTGVSRRPEVDNGATRARCLSGSENAAAS